MSIDCHDFPNFSKLYHELADFFTVIFLQPCASGKIIAVCAAVYVSVSLS